MPRLGDAGSWTLSFLGVLLSLGGVVLVHVVDRVAFQEGGISVTGQVVLALLGTSAFLVGIWILPILMTRTPLKILLRPKGTAVLWTGVVMLGAVFSFAPVGPHPDGRMRPTRGQDPSLRTRPNVLLVLVDSLRADHVGTMAQWPADHTPALDALAAEGVVFEQAYAAASWTRSSGASIFSSLLPASHRTDGKASILPAEVYTIAELLQDQGWVTGGFPNSIHLSRSFNFQQGFDYYRYLAPNYLFGGSESASQLAMYSVVRALRARMVSDGLQVCDYYQSAESALGEARNFISAQGEDRWFLFVHLMEPHDPYFSRPLDGTGFARAENHSPEPEGLTAMRAAYAAEISAMDRELGLFFGWMSRHQWDDTLVLVTSDHGEEFQDHGGWWHGVTLYDEQLHVPLIIKMPHGRYSGSRAPWQVRTIDLAPTVAAAVGVPIPPQWQGLDLFDRSFNEGQSRLTAEAAMAAAVFRGDVGARPPPIREPRVHPEDRVLVAQEDFEGNRISAIRAGGWKYIRAVPDGPRGLEAEELFHVSVDLAERTNLAGGAGVVQARLDQLLTSTLALAAADAAAGRDPALHEAASQRLQVLGYSD
jgi:arylsulfatase A-like enzyme